MIRLGLVVTCLLPLTLAGCGDGPAAFGITGPGTTVSAPVMGAAAGGSSAAASTGMTDDPPRGDGAPEGRFWRYNTR